MKSGMWIGGLAGLLILAGCGDKAANEPSPTPVVSEQAEATPVVTETPEEQPSATDQGVNQVTFSQLDNVFGFANEAGDQLITIPNENGEALDNPEQFNSAIGNDSEQVEIEFVRHQEADEQDTNRQTAGNFTHMAGYLYKVKSGKLLSNKSYLLAREGVVSKESLVGLTGSRQADGQYLSADANTITQVEALKNRKVTKSSLLAESPEAKIALFVFERDGDDMLASIAYISGDQVLFKDFPATYNESGTWRVDGGDDPGLFEVSFLAHSDEGLLLGIAWAGAEGENLYVLQEKDGALQDTDLTGGRYWSP
ncbi:hypothetical protein [Paenibacillus glycanilyticus]|uniref:Lipoprotein n=1 Tax=Paenibacillus glycanilyticus TaxID=126569 RepID=A0ABQ6GEZ3_9BACL|nr:hypothetical protein [Paenibacillus glycanilyticus]GLX68650.1 hypothetical protein MU1_29950 [Paenibacillus glycanilyticus]